MNDNPISSPNEVSTKSTFEDWRQITNQIIKRLNSLYSESGENGAPDDNLHVWNDATIGTSGFGTLTVTGNVEVGKDLIIENDLIVKGSTTTVNTVDLIVKDRMIELNHDPFYRNHPYNDKLKSGLQVHVGIDNDNLIVSYENDWPEALGLFKNQVTSIEYQISEGEDYEIDKDKTDLIMGTDEPEVTLIFDSFSLQKTGDPLDKFVVGDKIKGHTSGAEAVIKSIVQQNSDFDVEIRINYLESVSERDSVFEIGEYVFDPNETQENIDAALAYMQQWNSEGSKVQTVQNNQSLSSLDLSNKKYVLRFKDINGQVDNKMFFVDTYDIDTKKLTIVGDASEYKTQHQYLIDLDFQIQEIKTQKFYWDEATEKWTFDYDLNVLGDIYSNGKTLWKIVPNQDSQIYYNGNVAVGKIEGDYYTSPLAKLHIVSDTDDLIRLNDWKFSKSNDDLKLSFNTDTNNLTFKSDNTDNIILDSKGSIKLSNGVIRNSSGTSALPSYTFHTSPTTGISLGNGLNFSVDGENVFRVTKPDMNNTTTDGVVIEKGGLVIRPSDVNPSTPIDGLIRYNQGTKDFEGYRITDPGSSTGDWYSFTSSNDSGGAYTVYSKSDTIPDLHDFSDSNIAQYYWYTKLTIPAPTQTADYIYTRKSQGGDVFCDFYSFDFYGYIKNQILDNSYPSGSDEERGYGTTDSEIFHYKFYVERDFNVIDNNGTKEVVLNTDIKVKKIEGIDVEEKSLQGFQFWFVNTNNDETEIYFRYPIGYSSFEIVDNSILSQDFEKLETTWFSEIHGIQPIYQNNWPPTGVHQDNDYINIEQMSLWKTASTDRNKIYYDGGLTGFVGIGLDNPEQRLHVDGLIRSNYLSNLPNPNPENVTGYVLVSNSDKDIISSSITTNELEWLDGVTSNIQEQLNNIDTSKWTDIATGIYRNSNVGIGDFSQTALTEKLVVDGDIGLDGNVLFKHNNVESASIVYSASAKELYLVSRNNDVQPFTETSLLIGHNKLDFVDSNTNPYPILHEGNSWAVKDISGNIHYSSGNVGIGTSSPSEKLHVDGDSFIDGVLKLKPKQISKVLNSSDADQFDNFGSSVALSSNGSVLAVGASRWDGVDNDKSAQGGVYVYDWSGSSWVQRGSVLNAETNADPSDYFGSSVALSSNGSVLAVGVPNWDADGTTNDQGAVYIYDWSDTDGDGTADSWNLRGSVLTAPEDGTNGIDFGVGAGDRDYFGSSVALSSNGSVLAVGAIGWEDAAIGSTDNRGAVYVYDWSVDTWNLRGSSVLKADTGYPDPTQDSDLNHSGDNFGSSVALSSDGSVLAVGAVRWDNVNNQGAVYIYDWSESSWNLRGSVLTAPEDGANGIDSSAWADANDDFGSSVALSSDGSVLAVGARWWDADGTINNDQGAVYLYDKSDDTWTLRGSSVLTSSDAYEYDNFGRSVALSSDGSVLAVGSPQWDGVNNDKYSQGGVYTYSLEANSFPLSVSDKGYGLNVINDNIVLNSNVEVTGSISEGGTLLSAKYAPIDIETSKWTKKLDNTIYRNTNVGIGDFSQTALTEKLEVDGNIQLTEDLGTLGQNIDGGSSLIFKNKYNTGAANGDREINTVFSQGYKISSDLFSGDLLYYRFSADFKDISNSSNNLNTTLYEWIQGHGNEYNEGNHNFTGNLNVSGSISEGGTLLSAKYAPIDIETSKWTDIATGIYRNSKIGIGDFSGSDITDNLEIRSTYYDNYLKIKSTVGASTAPNYSCGIKLERKCLNANNYWVDSNYVLKFAENGDLNLNHDNTTIYNYDYSAKEHIFEKKVKVNSSITVTGDIESTGKITATGDIESTSDIRIKENLEIIENPIDKIKELNGYTFNKNGEEKRSAGLIAQEVEKVLPEVVSENSDGIKSLAYGNIVALLVETVKEQQKQIDELKKQISDK